MKIDIEGIAHNTLANYETLSPDAGSFSKSCALVKAGADEMLKYLPGERKKADAEDFTMHCAFCSTPFVVGHHFWKHMFENHLDEMETDYNPSIGSWSYAWIKKYYNGPQEGGKVVDYRAGLKDIGETR